MSHNFSQDMHLEAMLASETPTHWGVQYHPTDHALPIYSLDSNTFSMMNDCPYTYQKPSFVDLPAQDGWSDAPSSPSLYHTLSHDSSIPTNISYHAHHLPTENDQVLSFYMDPSDSPQSSCFGTASGMPSPVSSSFDASETTSSPLPLAPILPSQSDAADVHRSLSYGVSPIDLERSTYQHHATHYEDRSSLSPQIKSEVSPIPDFRTWSSSTSLVLVSTKTNARKSKPRSKSATRSSRRGTKSGSKYQVCRSETAKQIPCNWPGCGRRFSRKEHLTRHRSSHTGERPEECPFDRLYPDHGDSCGNKSRADNSLDHYKCHVRAHIIKTQRDVARKLGWSTKSTGLSMAEMQEGLLMIHGIQNAKLINKFMVSIQERLRKDFEGTEFDERYWSAEPYLLPEDLLEGGELC